MNKVKKPYFIKKKLAPLLLLIVIAALGGVGAYKFINQSRPTAVPPEITAGNINSAPATEEEKQASEQHKQELSNRISQEQSNSNGTTKKPVEPVITFADKTTVNAYTPGVFEEGGACTATLTQNSQVITRTSVGFQNVSYTQCAPIDLTGANLGTGSWSVVVSYNSTTAEGKSQPRTIQP